MRLRIMFGILALTMGFAWAFTDQELAARFYYDLGPETLDVASYPLVQQENYKIFKETCGRCHSLARPLNSPITSRGDWQRYVRRMSVKSRSKAGAVVSPEAGKAVVEFLVFDAQERKIKGKAEFAAQAERLKARFIEVQSERARLQQEEGRRKAHASAPYTGDKP